MKGKCNEVTRSRELIIAPGFDRYDLACWVTNFYIIQLSTFQMKLFQYFLKRLNWVNSMQWNVSARLIIVLLNWWVLQFKLMLAFYCIRIDPVFHLISLSNTIKVNRECVWIKWYSLMEIAAYDRKLIFMNEPNLRTWCSILTESITKFGEPDIA